MEDGVMGNPTDETIVLTEADQDRGRLYAIADLLGVPETDLRERIGTRLLYASANGDRWLLVCEPNSTPIVRHVANAASGGDVTDASVPAVLARDVGSPQYQALAGLINDALTAYLAG